MTTAIALFLALSAFGFWVWVVGSFSLIAIRLFSPSVLPNASHAKLFMCFFLPFIGLVVSAILSKV